MLINDKLKSKLNESLSIKLCLARVNKRLRKRLDYLKTKQVDATYSVCVLPTGYGKTVLFSTIPIHAKIRKIANGQQLLVIISPLNAIIAQQQQIFRSRAVVLSGIFVSEKSG
jgi:CRISPR/Cas system-associated endonuclease/helicase Cas3